MVHNEVIKRHEKCLKACEEYDELCKLKLHKKQNCNEQFDLCGLHCDFDHSPN